MPTEGIRPAAQPVKPPEGYSEGSAVTRARAKLEKQVQAEGTRFTEEAVKRALETVRAQMARKEGTTEVSSEIHTGRKLSEMMISQLKSEEKRAEQQLQFKELGELIKKHPQTFGTPAA